MNNENLLKYLLFTGTFLNNLEKITDLSSRNVVEKSLKVKSIPQKREPCCLSSAFQESSEGKTCL